MCKLIMVFYLLLSSLMASTTMPGFQLAPDKAALPEKFSATLFDGSRGNPVEIAKVESSENTKTNVGNALQALFSLLGLQKSQLKPEVAIYSVESPENRFLSLANNDSNGRQNQERVAWHFQKAAKEKLGRPCALEVRKTIYGGESTVRNSAATYFFEKASWNRAIELAKTLATVISSTPAETENKMANSAQLRVACDTNPRSMDYVDLIFLDNRGAQGQLVAHAVVMAVAHGFEN